MTPLSRLILLLGTLSITGCVGMPAISSAQAADDEPTATETAQPSDAPVAVARLSTTSSAAPGAAAEPNPDTARSPGGMSPLEVRLWNDPEFQRQFAESYMAENSETEPRVTQKEREQLMKIVEMMSAGKLDEAAALLDKGRGAAASPVFDFMRANIHFQKEEYSQAAELYTVAVERYRNFLRAWRNLALIHVRQGNYPEAIAPLTRVIELGGGDAITYGLLGFAYSSVENNMSAETAYRMAILLDPRTRDWKMGLARALFKQERFADAVALTGQLIAADTSQADLWLLQANALISLNRPMEAAKNYEIVDRMGKSTPESLTILGDIYVNGELYDLGVDAYVRALELESTKKADPTRLLRAAQVLTARGAMDETRTLLEKIERVAGDSLKDEDRKTMLKLRARIAVADGADAEQARVLEEIVKLDPLDGEALILLGQYSAEQGDIDKAVFYYERAEKIDKFEADAKVRHAQLLVKESKYDEALPLLRSAQQIKPRENVQKYLEQVERIAKGR